MKIIKLESGDVIVASNEITGPVTGWIDALYTASRSLPKFGILAPLLLYPDGKIYWHGGFITETSFTPTAYGMGEGYIGQYPGTRETEIVPLDCCIVSKELLAELPIPEEFEDSIFISADYCLKAIKNGFKIYATDLVSMQFNGGPHTEAEAARFSQKFENYHNIFQDTWGDEIEKRRTMPVIYECNIDSPSGFAMVARNYIKALTRNGVRVHFESLQGFNESEHECGDSEVDQIRDKPGNLKMPMITWGQAPAFFKNGGKYKIGHCEFEGKEWPALWAHYANEMDEIWVPTEWDKQKALRCGITVPIFVIYQGIDPDYFNPSIVPAQINIKEEYKFLAVGAWDPRKNYKALIEVFTNTFKREEDVCLIIKTINLGLTEGIQKEIKAMKYNKKGGKVYVKEVDWPKEQLGCLYTMADCLVLPTHGEGWGLPIFEALASGVPVITTGYGAPFEVLRDDKGKVYPGLHFIPYTEAKSETPYIYLENNVWAEPDRDALGILMRQVYDNRQKEKIDALLTSKIIRERFAWQEVVKPIQKRLAEIYKKLDK